MLLRVVLGFGFCLIAAVTGQNVRLRGGIYSWEGRVEILVNGAWGTVCDDQWDVQDAKVVCRQLGYSTSQVQAFDSAHFGRGLSSSRIWLDDVRCTGYESRLTSCSANALGVTDCTHSEDAGVSCRSVSTGGGNIRLRGGTNSWEGRVEILVNGAWGTVCDDQWDVRDAKVVCRQLGYSTSQVQAFSRAHFGQGLSSSRIWLDNVRCTGYESRLTSCSANALGVTDCTHSEDAGVSCRSASTGGGNIRLRGGTNSWEGRVEILVNGAWGTVCDDQWDVRDAKVVCRQLGYGTSQVQAFSSAHFGRGLSSARIWLDNVRCTGYESRLTSCSANSLGVTDCTHSEDAGVSCGSASTEAPSSDKPESKSLAIYISVGLSVHLLIIIVVVIYMCCYKPYASNRVVAIE